MQIERGSRRLRYHPQREEVAEELLVEYDTGDTENQHRHTGQAHQPSPDIHEPDAQRPMELEEETGGAQGVRLLEQPPARRIDVAADADVLGAIKNGKVDYRFAIGVEHRQPFIRPRGEP